MQGSVVILATTTWDRPRWKKLNMCPNLRPWTSQEAFWLPAEMPILVKTLTWIADASAEPRGHLEAWPGLTVQHRRLSVSTVAALRRSGGYHRAKWHRLLPVHVFGHDFVESDPSKAVTTGLLEVAKPLLIDSKSPSSSHAAASACTRGCSGSRLPSSYPKGRLLFPASRASPIAIYNGFPFF